jgi:DNA-binding NtrC family response regulator
MRRPVILVVDADAGSRSDLAAALERMHFDVRSAAGPEDAAARIVEAEPDVVLLDLPSGATGLQALAAIGARAPHSDVIVLTEDRTIDAAMQALRGGAFDYICRPCRIEEVEMRIRRALEWQRLRRLTSRLEAESTAVRATDIPTLRDTERLQLQRALAATGGRRAAAARLLGISERNLYRKIHTFGLETGD